jgi:DNA-directed RNA polymerase
MASSDLMREQRELEELMGAKGASRLIKLISGAEKRGTLSYTSFGRFLISSCIEKLSQRIEGHISNTDQPGRGHKELALLQGLPTDAIAFLTIRTLIDAVCKQDGLGFTSIVLGSMLEGEINAIQLEEDDARFYGNAMKNLPTSEGVRTRAHKLKTMKSRYKNGDYKERPTSSGLRITDWAQRDKTIIGTVLLTEAAAITSFGEIRTVKENGRKHRKFFPSAFLSAWLSENKERTAVLFPFYWPCIVPPKAYSTVDDGGYYTLSTRKAKQFVKTRDSNFLNSLREADLSAVYNTLNIAQNTAWRVNKTVLNVLRDMWDNNVTLGVLPYHDETKRPACPKCGMYVDKEHPCFVEDKEVFRDWKYKMDQFHNAGRAVTSKQLRVARALWIAESYEKYPAVYFPYQVDYRGRLYATPDFLNPQSDDLGKGLLEFAEGKPIAADEARQWFLVHIANTYGYDKVSYRDRVHWVEEHHDDILACAESPLDGGLWAEADSPWCFLAACIEYKGYQENPHNFLSHIAVAQDGTCSGLQHYSAMLRDAVGGAAVNLTPSDKPQDIYAVVAEKTRLKLEGRARDSLYAQEWLDSGLLNRKLTKRSVMTLPYGVTGHSSRDFILKHLQEVREKTPQKIPWHALDIFQPAKFLAELVWEAIGETVIAASEAMRWLKTLGAYAIKHNCPLVWTAPTGMVVRQTYMNMELRRVKTHLYGDVLKSFVSGTEREPVEGTTRDGLEVRLNFKEATDKLDSKKNVAAFAPNFVHSLDASALVFAVNKAHSEHGINSFALIHDSFGTHAADSATLARVLREEFVSMYERNDVLQQLYDEIVGYVGIYKDLPPMPPERGTLDLKQVLESQYFFA